MVTIIIPTYNAQDHVKTTLASILECGSGLVSEVIICNDASIDRSSVIVDDFIKEHGLSKSWHFIHHDKNMGGAAARNSAADMSSNDWIFCLDSDNLLTEGVIEHLYNLSKSHPEGSIFSLKKIGFFVEIFGLNIETHQWIFPSGEYSLGDHLSNTESPGSSGNYLFSKKAWQKAGKYRLDSLSLDSWCFALDALNNNIKMIVSDNDEYYYRHRYGIDSYWVRESKSANIVKLASQLISSATPNILGIDYSIIDNSDSSSFDLETFRLVIPSRRYTKVKRRRAVLFILKIIKKLI